MKNIKSILKTLFLFFLVVLWAINLQTWKEMDKWMRFSLVVSGEMVFGYILSDLIVFTVRLVRKRKIKRQASPESEEIPDVGGSEKSWVEGERV
jgi:hypothetical protein